MQTIAAGNGPCLAISEWLTGALLDRLTHHAHILEMNGDSYRLKQSRRKRGSFDRHPPRGTHLGEKGPFRYAPEALLSRKLNNLTSQLLAYSYSALDNLLWAFFHRTVDISLDILPFIPYSFNVY
jgi:hypothetical protein